MRCWTWGSSRLCRSKPPRCRPLPTYLLHASAIHKAMPITSKLIDPGLRTAKRAPGWLRWVRGGVRSIEFFFVLLAIPIGMIAGLLAVIQGALARTLQHLLFALPADLRLSGMPALSWPQLIVLPLGGAALAVFSWAVQARRRRLVDAVEANALHGGRMSLPDSAVIAGQTIISNGFGASVGLEAAYAQLGGVTASLTARWANVRRGEARTLVGAGAGAAIAAAFGAPLAAVFYAFEVVIGAYTPSAIAPVAAAALAGAQVAQRLGVVPYIVDVDRGPAIQTLGYIVYGVLGAACRCSAWQSCGPWRSWKPARASACRAGHGQWSEECCLFLSRWCRRRSFPPGTARCIWT